MRLDRNGPGDGKYMLIKNRRVTEIMAGNTVQSGRVAAAIEVLRQEGVLDDSAVGQPGEFFVIRLRDVYADRALWAYAYAARDDNNDEYAGDVLELAARAGAGSPFCKRPD